MSTPSNAETNLVECQACGNRVKPDGPNCPICGFPLKAPNAVPATKRTDLPMLVEDLAPLAHDRGSALFDAKTSLVLHVLPGDNYLTLVIRKPTLLGRGVGTRSLDPEELIDLTEFGAYRYGVSRHHCQFQRNNNELEIKDLGSSNGTYLNEKKLPPHKGFTVCDGDQIRLGALNLVVSFSKAS